MPKKKKTQLSFSCYLEINFKHSTINYLTGLSAVQGTTADMLSCPSEKPLSDNLPPGWTAFPGTYQCFQSCPGNNIIPSSSSCSLEQHGLEGLVVLSPMRKSGFSKM